MSEYIKSLTAEDDSSYLIKENPAIHYGICSTAAATVAKTVDIDGFKLDTGSWIAIKFTVTNTGAAGSLTLNVNNTGAYSIKYRNGNLDDKGYLAANRIYLFLFDGTYWQIVGDIDAGHPVIVKSTDTTSTASPAHGGTFTVVDSITREANGHVTKINTKTVTLPADSNTDTKVTQTNTTTSADYRVLLSGNANDTTETTTGRKSVNLRFNPSSGGLYSFGFLRTDITGKTLDINTLNLSDGTLHSRRFIEKTDGGAGNITNIPVAGKPFLLEVDLIRFSSATDYITRQRFTNAANGAYSYVRYCTNGTWGSWTTRKYTDTDTKVTSSANHYTPATVSGQDKSASASGATAAWSIDVVKGVTLNTDGKGHVTGISVTSGKIPANPVPSNNVTGSGTSGYLTKWNGTNTITNGPQLGSSTTTFLRNDGSWATPTNTTYSAGTGLSLSGTTFNHSNSVPAETTFDKSRFKYDAQGHITESGYYVHTAKGTDNTNGWIKIATMQHIKTRDNTPIMLTISQRGDYLTYRLHIQFTNSNTTDPPLGKFIISTDESETEIDRNPRAYMIKTAAGKWDLYIQKKDNYEALAVTEFDVGSYFDDHMTWTWQDVQTADSEITGGTEAERILPFNAYQSRTANTVLAAPNGSNGVATFRKLVAADIPDLDYVPNTQAGVSDAINLLSTGSTTPALADYYVAQYANGGTTTKSYLRRPISALWNAFKGLITLTTTGTGNAVTAVSIANDGGNNRKITVTKGSTFSLSTHTHNYAGSSSAGGAATSADKLTTARTITLGNEFQGSASFDGSANITINGSHYRAQCSGQNTANYPWHRIAYCSGKTGTFSDIDAIIDIWKTYDGGSYGRIKISLRTNGTGAACSASAKWIYRYGFEAADIKIARWGVTGNSVYADVFLKCGPYPRVNIVQIHGNRAWTLVASSEVKDTTSSDKKGSVDVYKTIEAAATELHNQAYTEIEPCEDVAYTRGVAIPRTESSSDANSFPGKNLVTFTEWPGTSTNNTPTAHFYHILRAQGEDTKYGTQLALGMNVDGVYYRRYSDEKWGAWHPLGRFTTTPTSGQVVITDGTAGGIKSSGYTIAKSVPSNAVFTDTKVNVSLATTSKAYLLATTTTPKSTAAAVTSIADTGVYLGTAAGSLYATSFYENGTSLSNKYAPKSGTPSYTTITSITTVVSLRKFTCTANTNTYKTFMVEFTHDASTVVQWFTVTGTASSYHPIFSSSGDVDTVLTIQCPLATSATITFTFSSASHSPEVIKVIGFNFG